ncbi:MAG: hypothetical protein ACOX56_05970 [Acholeplasmataceae bacterium]
MDNISSQYTQKFIDNVCSLRNVDDSKIIQLLTLDNNNPYFSYNQTISEFMLYFLLNKKNINFEIEKNKNPSNDKNVDVCFNFSGINFNIEIKSPEFDWSLKDDTLRISSIFRQVEKKEHDEKMNELKSMISEYLEATEYKSIQIRNLTDNKIKSCLLNAQDKFGDPSSIELNILFINSTTTEMISYWNYIVNYKTGFFHPHSDVSCFQFKVDGKIIREKKLNKKMYNKVNMIILSNALTLNEREDCSAWDISKSINIFLRNPNSKKISYNGLKLLEEIFPNKTVEFEKFITTSVRNNLGIPAMVHFYSFMSNNGFDVNEEKEKIKRKKGK